MRIKSIIINLLTNAIKFSGKNQTIYIKVKVNQEENESLQVEISIQDSGIGINE